MAYFDTGDKIRELRKERGLNQDQLAELASLNRVTIAKYESGRVEPGAQALSRIADALEVSTDVLLGRAEELPERNEWKPKTIEAQLVSGAMDKLPQEQRDIILNVVRAMCAKHPELFDEEKGDDDES